MLGLCMYVCTYVCEVSYSLLLFYYSTNAGGHGTGFIAWGGKDLVVLVTVHHVINNMETALASTFTFQYQKEGQGVAVNGVELFAGCSGMDVALCPAIMVCNLLVVMVYNQEAFITQCSYTVLYKSVTMSLMIMVCYACESYITFITTDRSVSYHVTFCIQFQCTIHVYMYKYKEKLGILGITEKSR